MKRWQDGSPRIECTHLLLGLGAPKCRSSPLVLASAKIACARIAPVFRASRTDAAVSTTPEVHFRPTRERRCNSLPPAADQTGAADIGPEHLLCGLFLADARLRSKLEEGGLTPGQNLPSCWPELLKDAQRPRPAWLRKAKRASRTAANPRQDSLRNRLRSSPPAMPAAR